jgi:hypothetical protein
MKSPWKLPENARRRKKSAIDNRRQPRKRDNARLTPKTVTSQGLFQARSATGLSAVVAVG